MSVELIQEVLAQHRVRDQAAHRTPDRSGLVLDWRYYCACGWRSEPIVADDLDSMWAARVEAERHQSERVWEAIQHGAAEAPGAEPESTVGDPREYVPAIEAVA